MTFILSHLDWLGFALTLLSIILSARKNIWCWPVGLLGGVAWTIYALHPFQQALLVSQIVFGILEIYGWWKWSSTKAAK
jgi:nicotinamide mononucleotide transporter